MNNVLAVAKSLVRMQEAALSQANTEILKLNIQIEELINKENFITDIKLTTREDMLLSNKRYWLGIKCNAELVINYIKKEVEQAEIDELEYLASMEELVRESERPITMQI